ncbi:DUF2214 family protein [Kumtagia ephedrae]|uniref:DUF2214 domain-containing protein n=1 Tax=Kumtagia ephedrae TaxID=2116701 RepID=A0A2P7S6E4_9HYPH|nr:DUF2214 family protein [Mesorhizobium ephedrae]PSJ58036.1 DUF2214 domain-containing protein [Mesorhizobium ephedrae]
MDDLLLDLVLAIAHHFLAFLLAALIAVELALVRPGLGTVDLARLGRVDSAYGGVAMLLILVGIGRVVWGLKGWEYYVYYPVFWMKMAAFVAIGLLSIGPTRHIVAWRRAGLATVPDAEVSRLRGWLKAEAAFLALVLVFAASMARGVGY